MAKDQPTILFIDLSADVAEVVALLEKAKSQELIISIPQRALLIQSVINLHILKNAADNLGKSIKIATSDPMGQRYAQTANIEIDTKSSDQPIAVADPQEPDLLPSTEEADSPIQKLTSSFVNPLVGFRTKQLDIEEELETEEPFLENNRPAFRLPALKMPAINWRPTPHQKIVLAISALGVAILAVVAAFVLPRAYVALEVQSEPYQKQFTLTLADEQDLASAGPNIIAGRFIEITREHVAEFSATGEENKGEPASGQINIVNYTNGIQGILANTRFATENGLVFRIKNEILVPPARGNIAGRAVVDAVSESGGTKYNIASPNVLTIPNISASLKPLLYGEVVGQFSGGTDNVVKVVSKEDIDRGKEEAAKNIFVATETELAKQVKRNEEFNPAFIQNDVIDAVPSVTPSAEQEIFEIRVQSRSWTIVLPKNDFATALANAATFEVDSEKQVTDETLASAQIEPVESNFITHRISLLVSLNGRVGPRLNKEEIIKNIVNKPKIEAESYLQNLANITNSSVDLWPSFLSRLPYLVGNIRLQVIYLGQ